MQSTARRAPLNLTTIITLGLLVILFPLVVIGAYLLPSPVALMAPGPVEPVEALIKVEGRSYESQGHLYVTTVRLALEPRLGQYLLAQLQTDIQPVPKNEVMPSFLSREEYQRLSQRLLEESQNIAQVVALRQAGYEIKLGNIGVEVVATAPGTPAAAQLQAGDIIETVNGESISTAAELVSIVQGRIGGEPLTLRIRRSQRSMTVTVPATAGPLDAQGPVLGIIAVTTGFDYRAPLDIKIDSGPVAGGPSAGLIYALGIYNAVATEDITRGHRIAGTGTIRLNGTVGPVGGVQLKVRAAEAAGAEYFLVPVEDATAARAAAADIKIIPVHNLHEALNALRELDSDSGRNLRVVPASRDNTLARYSPPLPACACPAAPYRSRATAWRIPAE